MAKLTITVFVKNDKYGEALERGLAQQKEGIQILQAESSHMAAVSGLESILLTDIEAYGSLVMNPSEFKKKAADEILRKAAEKYFNETGIKILSEEEKAYVWEIFSFTGGAGVTSFAVTAARILSMTGNGNILYINLKERDDYKIYSEFDMKEISEVSSKRKFIYMMRNLPEKLFLQEYLIKDRFGVFYFCPQSSVNSFFKEAEAAEIIDRLQEEKFFRYILVDSSGMEETESAKIQISHIRDKRSGLYSQKGRYLIRNYSGHISEDDLSALPEDEKSFAALDNKIVISMEGQYAEAVRKVTEKIISEQKCQ